MPKMKTKASAKKRFKVTGSGKIKRKQHRDSTTYLWFYRGTTILEKIK